MTVSCRLSAGPYCLHSDIICGFSRSTRTSTVNNPLWRHRERECAWSARESDLITSHYLLHYSSATVTLRMAFLHSLLGRLSSPGWVPNWLQATHIYLHTNSALLFTMSPCHHLLPGLARTFCLPGRCEIRSEKQRYFYSELYHC